MPSTRFSRISLVAISWFIGASAFSESFLPGDVLQYALAGQKHVEIGWATDRLVGGSPGRVGKGISGQFDRLSRTSGEADPVVNLPPEIGCNRFREKEENGVIFHFWGVIRG